jgi:uncharacterized peroxidase-related enzyme
LERSFPTNAPHPGETQGFANRKEKTMTQTFHTTLPLRSDADPDSAISGPLAATRRKMGMVPNMYRAMANLPALLDSYDHGYRLFREQAGFSPVEQEVVLLTVSRENACHYCVAAHSFVADNMSKVPSAVTDAIRNGTAVDDPRLEALRSFARAMVQTRGNPTEDQARQFLAAGFPKSTFSA